MSHRQSKRPHGTSGSSSRSSRRTTHVSNGLIFVIDPSYNLPLLSSSSYSLFVGLDIWKHLSCFWHSPTLRYIPRSQYQRLTYLQQSTQQLIDSLNTHRVNTLTELRRIERVAAEASDEDALAFQSPMTSAWTYYVTSNNLLSELRNLTRNYPFSSDMLDDAKWRVSNDPDSNRSWNFAWLVLVRMKDE